MRFVAIALAVLAAGCADDTVLRIDIADPGISPAPASLRVTLVGVSAAPRTIAPVTLPGTIVVTHVPSSVGQLCVDITYSTLLVGVTRSVSTDLVAYIDDVAVGPSRLYCPP